MTIQTYDLATHTEKEPRADTVFKLNVMTGGLDGS